MKTMLTALLAVSIPFAAAAAPIGLSLGDNGRTLVRIGDLSNPSSATGIAIVDETGRRVSLSDIDFRPATGEVFGYSNNDDAVYRVDVKTGVATKIVSMPGATGVETLGIDFNNAIDAARIITTNGENYVFFPQGFPGRPDAPEIVRFTDLGYAAGDVNFGIAPEVFGNAYLNAVPGGGTMGAFQFAIDAETDSLITLANNTGVLATVGELWTGDMRLDVTANGGFDIFSVEDGMGGITDMAFALLTTFEGIGLYELSLMADMDGRVQATLLGMTGGEFGALRGLTVFDPGANVAPIPLPGSAFMLLAALGGIAALRRRSA